MPSARASERQACGGGKGPGGSCTPARNFFLCPVFWPVGLTRTPSPSPRRESPLQERNTGGSRWIWLPPVCIHTACALSSPIARQSREHPPRLEVESRQVG